MKNVLISSILGLCLFACASHKDETPVVSPPVWEPVPTTTSNTPPAPVVSASQKITGDTWSFTVPGNWNKINFDDEPTIKAVYGNSDIKGLVLIEQESFDGKLDDYAQQAASAILHQGDSLISSTEININGQIYYLIVGVKGEVTLRLWAIVVDGNAYALTCGGPTNSSVIEESCNSIANSLVIHGHGAQPSLNDNSN